MERVNSAERVEDVLSDDQRKVMARVLAEEEARREHVVVYLSGAHAYGFPSPDSDLDLKAIHVARTADLLGFEVPAPTVDRAEIIDGVEIDYTSNETRARARRRAGRQRELPRAGTRSHGAIRIPTVGGAASDRTALA
jgi:predicted nucleotidyltransferase